MTRALILFLVVLCVSPRLAPAQSTDPWTEISRSGDTALARTAAPEFEDAYLACLFGLPDQTTQTRGHALAHQLYNETEQIIAMIDRAADGDIASGGSGIEIRWIRARASTLLLAQARAATLMIATSQDSTEINALSKAINIRIANTALRNDAIAAASLVQSADAALATADYKAADQLYTRALTLIAQSSDPAHGFRSSNVSIAMGSARTTAALQGIEHAREILHEATGRTPFVDESGANARLLLAALKTGIRVEREAGQAPAAIINRAAREYDRLLRRSDLSRSRGAIRVDAMTQLARIDSDSVRAEALPILAALARAGSLIATQNTREAIKILSSLQTRSAMNDDDISHALRLHASVADPADAIVLLYEHAVHLPAHPDTPSVLTAATHLAAGVLQAGQDTTPGFDQAIHFIRMIRETTPDTDADGRARSLLATALMRNPQSSERLLEAAATWSTLEHNPQLAVHASSSSLLCLIAASQISTTQSHAEIAAHILATCDSAPQELRNQRGALVASAQTIANSLVRDDPGCLRESEALLALHQISPPTDTQAVAVAIDARCNALLKMNEFARSTACVEFAVDVLPDHAEPIIRLIAAESITRIDAHTRGFFADAPPMRETAACIRALSASLRWSTDHNPRLIETLSLPLAYALILSGDGAAAIPVLDDAGGSITARFARGEALYQQAETEQAFAEFRSLVERLDAGRTYNDVYFACWVRMLEILNNQDDAENRRAQIARESKRLLSIHTIGEYPACETRLKLLRGGADR